MEFTFDRDVFQNGGVHFTGEVSFNITRTHIYTFKNTEADWEEGESVEQPELFSLLAKANSKFGWEAVEITNEFELRNRMGNMIGHGDIYEDGERISTKIIVGQGAEFSYGYSHPTEEGYHSYSVEVYWNGENGWHVEEVSGGRDCDGVLETTREYTKLVTGEIIKGRSEVYDQFAQAAGY